MLAYQDVEDGCGDDGAIAAEPRVGNCRTKQRQQERGAHPGVDGRRGGRGGLPERAGQVHDQVAHDATEREPFRHFHSCKHRQQEFWPSAVRLAHAPAIWHRMFLESRTDDEERGRPPAGAGADGRTAEVVHRSQRRILPWKEGRLHGVNLQPGEMISDSIL